MFVDRSAHELAQVVAGGYCVWDLRSEVVQWVQIAVTILSTLLASGILAKSAGWLTRRARARRSVEADLKLLNELPEGSGKKRLAQLVNRNTERMVVFHEPLKAEQIWDLMWARLSLVSVIPSVLLAVAGSNDVWLLRLGMGMAAAGFLGWMVLSTRVARDRKEHMLSQLTKIDIRNLDDSEH